MLRLEQKSQMLQEMGHIAWIKTLFVCLQKLGIKCVAHSKTPLHCGFDDERCLDRNGIRSHRHPGTRNTSLSAGILGFTCGQATPFVSAPKPYLPRVSLASLLGSVKSSFGLLHSWT